MELIASCVDPFLVKNFPKKPVINADKNGIKSISKYIFDKI